MAVTAIGAAAAGLPPLAALLRPLAAAAAASLPPLVAARHSCRVQPAVAAAPRSDGPELPVPPAAPSKAQPLPPPALELGGERPNRDYKYKRMAMLAILPNRRVLSQQGLRVIWAKGDVMDSLVKRAIREFDGTVFGADKDKSSAYLAIPAATSMDQLPGGRSSPRPRSSF